MTLNNYNKTKPANIGIAVNPRQGSQVGDYMVLEEAINCIPLPKQAEARRFFGLASTLPLLYAIARRVLAVPSTSCDMERCFWSLKWVGDERQRSMKCDTHRAAVMLHYNAGFLVLGWSRK